MADNVKVGFQVTGDSADALDAIKQLAGAIVKLANVLEQFNTKATTSSTKAGAAIDKVKTGYEKAAAAAQKLQAAAAAVKPPDGSPQDAPSGGTAQAPSSGGATQTVKNLAQMAKQANQVKNMLVAIWPKVSSVANSALSKIQAGLAKLGNVPGLSRLLSVFGKVGTSGKLAFSKIFTAGAQLFGKLSPVFGALAVGASAAFGVVKKVGSVAFTAIKVAGKAAGTAFSTVLQSLTSKSGVLNRAIFAIGGVIRKTFSGNLGVLSAFGSGLDRLSKGFLNFVDVIRISAQGITNMGRVMFFFLTIPAIAFLKNLASAAINFEDALVRVQKTTNLASGSATQYEGTIRQLSDLLREQARYSMRSHVELAQIAEVVGQLGVQGVAPIANLTQIFDMMSTTMGVGADEVALTMGKIANAFRWNLESASQDVFRLGNVINYLENTTAASAAEIMTAMSKWAQAASLLNITAAEAAGLSAAMVSMGLTEEEAGTALKRLSSQLAANVDEIAILMGANEKYADRQAVLNAINTDTVEVFLDIAEAARTAREAGQNAQALEGLINIADERGGRALAALANNVAFVRDVLNSSNKEWENASSLITEYNRAMSSTKAHLAVVKNNINDVAITVGDALLPVIRQITTVMIPALQMFSNWFKNLRKSTQLTSVAIVGLVVVAGPLILIFGQLLHGIFLIFQGFGLLGKSIAFVVTNLARFLSAGGIISKAVLGWPLAIVAAAAVILKVLSKMGVDVAGFFTKLASRASEWGSNLMQTYGNGLASAANFVLKIVSKIASLIARFFEAHSPPVAGPLSTIDTWGSALLQTYLDGFKNADFSVLEEVGGIIEHILTRGVEDDDLPDVLKKYAKARVKLAQLIEQFNATGIVDEALLAEATDGLGEMQDEVQELIRLQMRYNQLQAELAELEAQKKDVVKNYNAEVAAIAASNMSIEEKVAAIREAQSIRDDSLRTIEEEKAATEEEADALKTQLEYQQKMIDAMNEQDDLLARIADAMERMSGGGGGGADVGGEPYSFGEADTSGFEETYQQVTEQLMSFKERVDEGKQALQGLFDAFNGKPEMLEEDWLGSDESYDMYITMYELGMKVRDVYDWVTRLVDKIRQIDFKGFFDSVKTGGADAVTKVSGVFETIKARVTPIIQKLQPLFAKIWDALVKAWDRIQPALSNLLGAIIPFFKSLGTLIAGAFLVVLAVLPGVIKAVGQVISAVVNIISGAMNIISGIIDIIAALFTGDWEGAGDGLKRVFEGILQVVDGVFTVLFGLSFSEIVQKFKDFVTGIVDSLKENPIVKAVSGWVSSAAGFIGKLFGPIIETIKGTLGGLWDNIGSIWTEKLGPAVSGLVTSIVSWVSSMGAMFVTIGNGLKTFFSGIWEKIGPTVMSVINWLGTAIASVWEYIKGLLIGIGAILGTAIAVIMGVLVGLWNGVVNAVNGVITFLGSLFTGLVQIVSGVFNVIAGIVQTVIGVIIGIFGGGWEGALAGLTRLWDGVKQIFTGIWEIVVGIFSGLWQTVSGFISGFVEGIVDWFVNLYNTLVGHSIIPDMLSDIITAFLTFFGDIISDVAGWVTDMISTVTGFVGDFVSAGADLLLGLAEGIGDAVGDVISEITGAVGAVIDTVLSLLGISSPSKVFMDIGVDTGLGFVEGIDGMANQINAAVSDSLVSPALDATIGMNGFAFQAGNLGSMAPEQYNITLQFGKDAVRSDDDITKIAAEVERILLKKTKLQFGYGTGLR